MRTILLTLGFSLCVLASSAQTVMSTPDSTVEVSGEKHRVITNKFFDNWFIGAGVGAQFFYGDHNRQMAFGDRIVPAYELHLGKHFTPGIGVRLALNGLKNKGVTQNFSHTTGVVYDESQALYGQEFQYLNFHGDVLFNLSNMVGGYNPTRLYSFSPYVGLGAMWTWEEPKTREVSANLGFFNSFRLSPSLDLTLDIRGSLVHDRFDGELGGRKDEGMLTTAVGIVYKFGKRTWNDKTKTVIRITNESELRALRDKVNELAADNNALKNQLANAKNNTVTEVVVDKNVLAAPILVTFPINKSTVSNEARVNLGFFAKVIKEGDPELSYSIVGYADKGTGSKSTNERLSRERAQAIYNVLVREFGVPSNQLEVDHKGGVDNMFYDDPRLSRAVITIGKYKNR